MTQPILVVVIALLVVGVMLRLNSFYKRWRYIRTIDPDTIERSSTYQPVETSGPPPGTSVE